MPRSLVARPTARAGVAPVRTMGAGEGPCYHSGRSPVRGRGATDRGDVAQLEEHCVRIAGVRGSSPLISTTTRLDAITTPHRRARRGARRMVAQPPAPRPCDRAGARRRPAQNRGPWPNTRRWASSWMTTVSSASGGARISRHEKASRPCREALPQRVRWSRTLSAVGLTPRAVACRADVALDRGARPRLEPRLEDRRVERRSAGARWTISSSSSAPPIRSTRRPPDARTRRHDAQAVEVAPVPDRGAVAQAAAGHERRRDRAPAAPGGAGPTARARRGTPRSGPRGSPSRVGWRAGR